MEMKRNLSFQGAVNLWFFTPESWGDDIFKVIDSWSIGVSGDQAGKWDWGQDQILNGGQGVCCGESRRSSRLTSLRVFSFCKILHSSCSRNLLRTSGQVQRDAKYGFPYIVPLSPRHKHKMSLMCNKASSTQLHSKPPGHVECRSNTGKAPSTLFHHTLQDRWRFRYRVNVHLLA